MAPTEADRKSAELLKTEGNVLFTKSKYQAAIETYTEAITLCPTMCVLYVNRAMCHKKRDDWQAVANDARKWVIRREWGWVEECGWAATRRPGPAQQANDPLLVTPGTMSHACHGKEGSVTCPGPCVLCRALQLEPNHMKGHYLMGLAYGAQKEHQPAMQHLSRVRMAWMLCGCAGGGGD